MIMLVVLLETLLSVLITSALLSGTSASKEDVKQLKERVDQIEVDQGLEMSTPKDECP